MACAVKLSYRVIITNQLYNKIIIPNFLLSNEISAQFPHYLDQVIIRETPSFQCLPLAGIVAYLHYNMKTIMAIIVNMVFSLEI